MTERSRAFLAELEAAAGLAPGMLSKRFLSVFTRDDPRLDAMPAADLARIRTHFLAAAEGRSAHRAVDDHTLLSPAEVQMFRRTFHEAGARILDDAALAPATRETLRYLCPWCADDGTIAAEDHDVEAPPALPGTAGSLRTDEPGEGG